jgi:hypothetical protein
MEPVLDIPAPEPTDSETVVSSLETAAIFGAKGDAAEALRWVQRAAESASESGDDARTLTLARTVAALSSRLNGTPELEGRRLPTPPGRPSAVPAVPAEEEAKPLMLESRSRPPAPSSRPVATSTPPPPPSARSRPASPAPDKPSADAAKSVTPSPPVVTKSASPSASSFRRVTPMPGTPRPSVPNAPSGTVARPPSLSPQPPKTASNGAATNGARPSPKSVTPSVLGAPPAAAKSSPPPLDASSDAASAAPAGRRARQAARVSVTRSLTERGLYFVRVLDEEQELADDAFEGLLVSNDPNQTLV